MTASSMTPQGADRRRKVLLAGLLIMIVVVIVDQMGLLGGSASDSPETSGYGQAAATLAQQRGILDAESEIDAMLVSAREQWSRAEPGLVMGQTAPLAEAALRRDILAIAQSPELRAMRAEVATGWSAPVSSPGSTAATGNAIRPIALVLTFDAPDTTAVYAAIDRIERAANLRARVVRVEVTGPGILEVGAIGAQITIEAPALIIKPEEQA